MARKKAANGSGSFERRAGNVAWVQCTLPRKPGEKLHRKRVPIPGSETMTDAQARREGAKLARDVRDGKIVFDEAPTAARPTSSNPAGDWRKVRQLGAAWTGGEMFKRFGKVNKLRVKAGAYIDKVTLEAHVYDAKTRGPNGPAFGDLDADQVTSDDVASVMGAQPADHRAETRIKQYNRLHRLFELAEFPCRLRKEGTNPVKKYLRPEADAEKLFGFLYPIEVLALLRGTNKEGEIVIPLARRVLYALAVYTGQRKGSLFALTWKHADFGHGTLASFKTKTGRAQYFVADRGLMALLEAWHEHRGRPGDDEPIIPPAPMVKEGGKLVADYKQSALGVEPKRLAAALQVDLKAVGVTRSILFESSAENVEPLRFHDLRSTFCTWARRAGKSDSWIGERTGHELAGSMINRYDRGAQTLADLDYEPFPDIARAIPELAARLHTRLHTSEERTKRPIAETPTAIAASVVGAIGIEPTTPTVSSGPGRSDGTQGREIASRDPVAGTLGTLAKACATPGATDEGELRRQIAEAILAGDDERAAELQARLGRPRLRVVR